MLTRPSSASFHQLGLMEASFRKGGRGDFIFRCDREGIGVRRKMVLSATLSLLTCSRQVKMKARERTRLHKILRSVGLVTLLLLLATWYLGYSTARHMKGLLRDQFNQQQLVLAQAAAMRIEANVQNAIADLILLNSLPAIQYGDREGYESLLLSTLPVLSRDQILEIRRVNRDGNTLFVASDQGISMEHIGVRPQEAGVYLSWASDVEQSR